MSNICHIVYNIECTYMCTIVYFADQPAPLFSPPHRRIMPPEFRALGPGAVPKRSHCCHVRLEPGGINCTCHGPAAVVAAPMVSYTLC